MRVRLPTKTEGAVQECLGAGKWFDGQRGCFKILYIALKMYLEIEGLNMGYHVPSRALPLTKSLLTWAR